MSTGKRRRGREQLERGDVPGNVVRVVEGVRRVLRARLRHRDLDRGLGVLDHAKLVELHLSKQSFSTFVVSAALFK